MKLNPPENAGRDPVLAAASAPARRDVFVSVFLRRPSRELAYLLGAWAAHTEVHSPLQEHLSFCSSRKNAIQSLAKIITHVTSAQPALERLPASFSFNPSFRVRVHCPAISQHFHEVSANNTRLPWENLGTPAERAAFLRGIFDHGGWISQGSSPGLGISKVLGNSLLWDLSRLCFHSGMYPLVIEGSVASLKLRDRSDWLAFSSEIGFSSREKKAQLASLCSMRTGRQKFSVEQYFAVRRLASGREDSPKQISVKTDVPENTVRDWLIRGQVPRIVTRFMSLQSHDKLHPEPSSIAAIYRGTGVSSSAACRIANRYTLERVTLVLSEKADAITNSYGLDSAIEEIFAQTTRGK